MDKAAFRVPLNGLAMHLRPSELESVAAGLGSSERGDLMALVEAVRDLPINDRAPGWELAVRRYGRHKPLAQAAGDIGIDLVVARDLLERFAANFTAIPPTDH